MTLKLGMQHRVLKYYQVCSNDDHGLTLTYFMARPNLVPCAFEWEKVKTKDILKTILVCDIKVSRWNQLNEYMKVYEYQRSRLFIDPGPSHSESTFSNFFSSITAKKIRAKFHMDPPLDGGTKVCSNQPGHMTKVPPPMPIYHISPYYTQFFSSSCSVKSSMPII